MAGHWSRDNTDENWPQQHRDWSYQVWWWFQKVESGGGDPPYFDYSAHRLQNTGGQIFILIGGSSITIDTAYAAGWGAGGEVEERPAPDPSAP